MRLAVISDIHGNSFALDTFLEDIKNEAPDQIVCLGDAIQAGAQPAETVATLRDLKIPTVMGNADAWLLSGNVTADEGHSSERMSRMEEIRLWSLSKLSSEDQQFITEFKPTIRVGLGDGQELLCFHGTHRDFDELLFPWDPEERFREILGPENATYFCGGHTHIQFIRHIGRRFFFNPGSVGFAARHDQDPSPSHLDPWAEYGIISIELGKVSLEFRRVPLDVPKMLEIIRESGRPYAETLIGEYGK
ncbi:MAG TPA: metallophosphoesterase family protein [Fimbriimonadaceae bacterium]|jgi:predicted phosphodiesterase